MRMIELLALVVLLPLFSAVFSANICSISECQKKYAEKIAPLNADRCLVNSFKRICGKEGLESEDFKTFVENYGAVLPVSSLSVETIAVKDRKKLLRCSWTSGNGKNYVLAVCEMKETF